MQGVSSFSSRWRVRIKGLRCCQELEGDHEYFSHTNDLMIIEDMIHEFIYDRTAQLESRPAAEHETEEQSLRRPDI